MATFAKVKLSGSTDGRAILVAGNNTGTATTIHTGSGTATTYDEIWLYAMNTHSADLKLTLEWGGTTSPNDLIEVTIGTEAGLVLVAPGLLIKGNASTALIVKAFAGTADLITIHGYVNQITA
jgi:hypothetical protein